MTQRVAVETDFRDIEQMAQGLTGRVHATHVILPAGNAVDEGAWAQFEITLYDGSAGLAGLGRCVTVVDNGEERLPHQRYDVVFDSLQFDTHEQEVFEHVLAMHGLGGQEIEQVADVDAESLPPQPSEDTSGFIDVSTEFTGSAAVANNGHSAAEASAVERAPQDDEGEIEGERTMIASADELAEVVHGGSVPAPGGEANDVDPAPSVQHVASSFGSGGTARIMAPAAAPMAVDDEYEEPRSGERIAPTYAAAPRAEGQPRFAYSGGIPFPARPPRPELDPSLRVTPAPRPAGWSAH